MWSTSFLIPGDTPSYSCRAVAEFSYVNFSEPCNPGMELQLLITEGDCPIQHLYEERQLALLRRQPRHSSTGPLVIWITK